MRIGVSVGTIHRIATTLRARSHFSEKGRGPGQKFLPALTYLPDATSACIVPRAFGRESLASKPRLHGASGKCVLIWLTRDLAPQRHPYRIRGPGGRPRFAIEFLP